MNNNNEAEISPKVLSSPALLFLHYRLEQILGIRATCDSLISLNEYIENYCGSSFVENPAAYEYLLTSREQIHNLTKFVTVNETYFFREGAHFELLAQLLPGLARKNRPLQICSAAVSIGCEAYSIAMLLDYHSKKGPEFDFAIDAFDVNGDAVQTAINGRYTANSLRNDGCDWKNLLDLYLVPDNGEYIVTQNIRKKVRFFSHNIIRGLDRQYDIIFFRNSLIYFTPRNRFAVINCLAESLFSNGLLFLGISETSSVKHHLLADKYQSNVFYFQKTPVSSNTDVGILKTASIAQEFHPKEEKKKTAKNDSETAEFNVDCLEISSIMETEEGKPNAEKAYSLLSDNKDTDTVFNRLSGGEISSSILYFLSHQNLERADFLLSVMEKSSSCAFTKFLRGEYYFLMDNAHEAQKYFSEAAVKNRLFWPAFYRMAALASRENRTSYEYKINRAINSIKLSQNSGYEKELKYECFMGGFSPDYFIRILEKKLA